MRKGIIWKHSRLHDLGGNSGVRVTENLLGFVFVFYCQRKSLFSSFLGGREYGKLIWKKGKSLISLSDEWQWKHTSLNTDMKSQCAHVCGRKKGLRGSQSLTDETNVSPECKPPASSCLSIIMKPEVPGYTRKQFTWGAREGIQHTMQVFKILVISLEFAWKTLTHIYLFGNKSLIIFPIYLKW